MIHHSVKFSNLSLYFVDEASHGNTEEQLQSDQGARSRGENPDDSE